MVCKCAVPTTARKWLKTWRPQHAARMARTDVWEPRDRNNASQRYRGVSEQNRLARRGSVKRIGSLAALRGLLLSNSGWVLEHPFRGGFYHGPCRRQVFTWPAIGGVLPRPAGALATRQRIALRRELNLVPKGVSRIAHRFKEALDVASRFCFAGADTMRRSFGVKRFPHGSHQRTVSYRGQRGLFSTRPLKPGNRLRHRRHQRGEFALHVLHQPAD